MTELYNRTSEKDKRQLLRNNMTQAEKIVVTAKRKAPYRAWKRNHKIISL